MYGSMSDTLLVVAHVLDLTLMVCEKCGCTLNLGNSWFDSDKGWRCRECFPKPGFVRRLPSQEEETVEI